MTVSADIWQARAAMCELLALSFRYPEDKVLAEAIASGEWGEAADEIARQLRLRNLNGMIIVDFIDMKSEQDRQTLRKRLEEAVSKDSLQTIVVGMTQLGLMQLTRKKKRESLMHLMTKPCRGGTGRISIAEKSDKGNELS